MSVRIDYCARRRADLDPDQYVRGKQRGDAASATAGKSANMPIF